MDPAQISQKIAADPADKNAQLNSDKENARIEHDKALIRVTTAPIKDDAELFEEFSDDRVRASPSPCRRGLLSRT